MARIAQPREVAELKGADKRNPQRYRGEPIKSNLPVGEPPEHLTEGEAKCWFELSAKSLPGVLTYADSVMLELASELLCKRRRWDGGDGLSVGERSALISILARLGMSPADRQKFTEDKPKDDNPFANLEQ